MQGTECCDDCLVTFICSREPGEAVVVDVAEARALRMLSEAGLLPALAARSPHGLRARPRTGAAPKLLGDQVAGTMARCPRSSFARHDASPDIADLVAVGHTHGLDAVGVAPARPFATTRRHLERRRAAGMHAGMAFTYRRPERSSDPGRALPGARAIVVGARSYRRAAAAPLSGEGAGPSESTPSATPLGRVARYAWDDHYAPLRAALTVVAHG